MADQPKHSTGAAYTLDEIDKKILALVLEFPEISKSALEDEIGLTRVAIANRMNKPAFQAAHADATLPLQDLIKDSLESGIRRLRQLVKKGSPKDAIEATKVLSVLHMGQGPGGKKGPGMLPGAEGLIFTTRIGQDGVLNRSATDMLPAPAPQETLTIDAETIDAD